MNVPLIQMSRAEARAKLSAYRAELRRRVDAEYEAAAAGYAELAKGTPLLNLAEAFAFAGLGADLRPRLAIARADRREVHVSVDRWNGLLTFDSSKMRSYSVGPLVINLSWRHPDPDKMRGGFALVPMVPADVRPRGSLRDYFVLWEVHEWSEKSQTARPDRDPYLLKYLAGDLYVVICEWSLTDLERAIMAGRRRT